MRKIIILSNGKKRDPAYYFGKEKQNTAPSHRAIHPISKGGK
jgi:hypothetical protein